MVRACPRIVGFWSRVFGLLFFLFHLNVRKEAKFALLHCPIPGLFARQQKLATYLFISAKRTIAQAWKKTSVPFQEVKNCLTSMVVNEQMSSLLKDMHARFLKVWEPWLTYAFPERPLASMDQL